MCEPTEELSFNQIFTLDVVPIISNLLNSGPLKMGNFGNYTITKLSQGNQGIIYSLNKKEEDPSIVLKKSLCDDSFKIELNYLNILSQTRLPHMPIVYGAFNNDGSIYNNEIKNDDCYLALPYASTTVAKLLMKGDADPYLVVSLLKQMIISIYCFHTVLGSYHCDTHTGNFFVFDLSKYPEFCIGQRGYKYCINKGEYITKVNANFVYNSMMGSIDGVYVAIYDLGCSKKTNSLNPPCKDMIGNSCENYVFDYFRMIDDSSFKKFLYPFYRECRNFVVSNMLEMKEVASEDFINHFRKIKFPKRTEIDEIEISKNICIGLLKILDKVDKKPVNTCFTYNI
jgi:hypothetical protein